MYPCLPATGPPLYSSDHPVFTNAIFCFITAPCSFTFDFIIAHPQLPAYLGGALLAGNLLLHSPHIGCREFPDLRTTILQPQSYFFLLLAVSRYHAELFPHAVDIAE